MIYHLNCDKKNVKFIVFLNLLIKFWSYTSYLCYVATCQCYIEYYTLSSEIHFKRISVLCLLIFLRSIIYCSMLNHTNITFYYIYL